MTAPIQYGTQPATDPTAVMGRRTLAWIADLLIFLAIATASAASMAEYVDVPAGVDDPCQVLEDQAELRGDSIGACIDPEELGVEMDERRVFLIDTGQAALQTMLSIGYLIFFIVLQGLTGGSPGKLLFGLRVVDEHGNRCGLGRSLGRTLMWIVDSAPWIFPLVGPIAAFTSAGHRRVGDLAAGTYVVASSRVGQPVVPGAAAPPTGQTAWGAPPPVGQPPTWGAPSTPPAPARPPEPAPEPELDIRDLGVPPADQPVDEAPPSVEADPDWSRPPEGIAGPTEPAGPADAPDLSPPTLPEVEDPTAGWEPPGAPSPFVAPGGDEPASTGPPTTGPTPPSTGGHELPPPQWDQARGTYLQWEPNQQAWLEWDAAAGRWKPINT